MPLRMYGRLRETQGVHCAAPKVPGSLRHFAFFLPFSLPLFKELWEMEVKHLSGALRLQSNNGRNVPESS